ncbi:MAG: type II secretion system minor pseudopilin GspK [Gammaproteobacteria bacterium]|nr:type II secretion system minor pseudopilin GspK [Gammaproteobacteria bacterium]
MNSMPTKQCGAALIMALLIIAIVAALASTLMLNQQVAIQRTEIENNATQAVHDANQVLYWAMGQYITHEKQLKTTRFPLIMPMIDRKNKHIKGSLSSAQGRFNINNVSNKQYIPLFATLIETVDHNISHSLSMQIAQATHQWLSQASNLAQTDPYIQFNPPYRIPHQLMTSASEFRLINYVTPELYQRIVPYIVALPEVTPVNPNAASVPVLISYGLKSTVANAVYHFAHNSHFQNLSTFKKMAQFKAQKGKNKLVLFSLKNWYYLVHAQVILGKINLQVFSLLFLDEKTKQLILLQQRQGSL